MVQVRAYATRIVVSCDEEVAAEHPRYFGRNHTIYNPWHYPLVLTREPSALQMVRLSKTGSATCACPPAPLAGHGDGADRWFVRALPAVLTDDLEPIEATAHETMATSTTSDDPILNTLARLRQTAASADDHHFRG